MNNFEKVSKNQFLADYHNEFGDGLENTIEEIYDNIIYPKRGSKYSSGYDISTPMSFKIRKGETYKFPTGLRCKIDPDTTLLIVPRSSIGFKYDIMLSNTVGVIDADYYNSDNEGHIWVKLINHGNQDVTFNAGDRICQGIFVKYSVTEDDNVINERNGGIGSTGE